MSSGVNICYLLIHIYTYNADLFEVHTLFNIYFYYINLSYILFMTATEVNRVERGFDTASAQRCILTLEEKGEEK